MAMKNLMKAMTFLLGLAALPAAAGVNVFACEPEWAALAEEIGGDLVSANSATTGLQDVHHIDARPSLIARLRQADLLVCTGAGLEAGWLPVLLRRANNGRVQPGKPGYMEASAYVAMLERPEIVTRGAGDVHAQGNPHIQLDARNFLPVADALAERLVQIDPANAAQYRAGLADFRQRWQAAVDNWTRESVSLHGLPIVVHHNSWVYLVRWLQLQQLATLEPLPGVPPSSAHLSGLLQQLQGSDAAAIIHSSYQNPRAANWLAERTSLPVIEVPTTIGGTPAATDLFSLFDDIVKQLQTVSP
jgi:zinc/manganese transport system substrate-binding protein